MVYNNVFQIKIPLYQGFTYVPLYRGSVKLNFTVYFCRPMHKFSNLTPNFEEINSKICADFYKKSSKYFKIILTTKSVLKHLPQCDWIMMSLCSSITINNEINRIKNLRKLFSDLYDFIW